MSRNMAVQPSKDRFTGRCGNQWTNIGGVRDTSQNARARPRIRRIHIETSCPPQELVELAPRIRVWLVRRNRCFITDDNQLHGAQQRRDFHYQLEL